MEWCTVQATWNYEKPQDPSGLYSTATHIAATDVPLYALRIFLMHCGQGRKNRTLWYTWIFPGFCSGVYVKRQAGLHWRVRQGSRSWRGARMRIKTLFSRKEDPPSLRRPFSRDLHGKGRERRGREPKDTIPVHSLVTYCRPPARQHRL